MTRRPLAAGAGLIAGGLALAAGTTRLGPSAERVSTIAVRRDVFVREVAADGALEAVNATPIVVPTGQPQTIAELLPDGSAVAEGEVVARFDPHEALKAAADGRDDLAAARSRLSKIEVEGETTTQGQVLEEELASRQLARVETFPPEDEEIFSRNERIEAAIDMEHFEKKVDTARRKLERGRELTDAQRRVGAVEAAKAELLLDHAREGLVRLEITAPHDGLLVLIRNWRGEAPQVGQSVWPGQKIAEIPDLARLQARVRVLEADAAGLRQGLAARVFLAGRPGVSYEAAVETVEPVAKPQQRGSPIKYFEAVLSIPHDQGDEALRPGARVRAVIELERLEGVISVPRAALFEQDGRRIVYREGGGGFEPVPVTVGGQSPSRVVILDGLEPGDWVALRDPTRPATTTPAAAPGAP